MDSVWADWLEFTQNNFLRRIFALGIWSCSKKVRGDVVINNPQNCKSVRCLHQKPWLFSTFIKSQNSNGSHSALLWDSRAGCQSAGGGGISNTPNPSGISNCRSMTVSLFTTTLSSGFSKPTNLSQKLPRKCLKPALECSCSPLGIQGRGFCSPKAFWGGFSKDRKNPVMICSASWNERH